LHNQRAKVRKKSDLTKSFLQNMLQNIKSPKNYIKCVVLSFFFAYFQFLLYLCTLILVDRKFMLKKCLYIVSLCCVLVLPVQAQIEGAGSSVFHFMGLPASARLNALGGENVSLADGDVSMAYMNPALLTSETNKVLQLNYAYYLAGTMFGSAMYGHNWGDNYFSASIHYLDYGKMDYTDEWGQVTGGTFTAKDMCVHLTYARQLGPMFRVGATIKPIFSVYERYTSFALGADVGGHFQTKDSLFQMGLALRNIGWQLKGFYEEDWGQHTEMLPLNLELGMSLRLAHAPLRFSVTMHNLQRWNLAPWEEEVKWYDMLFRHTIWALDIVPKSEKFYLTVSYNHRRQAEMAIKEVSSMAGLGLGAGLKIKKFRLGLAYSQYSKSNFTLQASLSTDINQFLK
jgi:hypothetical protein